MPNQRKNAVGVQLRKLRTDQGLSQAGFAALCQRNGWDISRETIARIEGCARCVTDFELLLLAEMLNVSIQQLLPPTLHWKKDRRSFLDSYRR